MSNIITQAVSGDIHHITVAKYYIKQDTSVEDVLATLKLQHYIVDISGTRYKVNAVSIVNYISGYRRALDDINAGIVAGSHKCSKAKGVYRVKTVAPKPEPKPEPIPVGDETELPF